MDIAGYRVLRTLARGRSADLVLGHNATSDPHVVVIRRPIDDADPRTERILAAYAAIEHPHVARLLDVGVDERGALCAVLERLPGDLPALLVSRDRLAAGEAVTVLAPIVMAVEALHDVGVAHGSLSAASVRLRDDGAPVLVGFGAAAFFPPASPEAVRERVPDVALDREALRELTRSVLGLVEPLPTELIDRIPIMPPSRLGPELLDVLRALGPPVAIGHASPVSQPPTRLIAPVSGGDEADVDDTSAEGVVRPGRLGEVVAAARRLAQPVLGSGPVAAVSDRLRERWRSLTTRARRLAVAGAVATAVIAIALAAIPAPKHSITTGSAPPGTQAPVARAPIATDPAVTGDDPLAAARALVQERDRCFRLAASSCLDGVDQPDSSAAASDRALIAALVDDPEPPALIEPGSLQLTQRWGDTALITLGPDADPASLLVMRGEAGWRIRSYEPRA